MQIETCRKVENSLKRFDRKGNRVQVLPFHAAMTQESRLASMEEFTRSPSKGVSQFMVCTDRYLSALSVNLLILDFLPDFYLFIKLIFTRWMIIRCK